MIEEVTLWLGTGPRTERSSRDGWFGWNRPRSRLPPSAAIAVPAGSRTTGPSDQIKTSFDAGAQTGQYDSTVWSAYGLRKQWNTIKAEVAPWWAECSKEAYANGIADATTALRSWHDCKTGKRKGAKVKFPKFKKKTRDRLRCQYTTGALRVAGPRAVVLPGVGTMRTAENLRALWRHVKRRTGRVLSATILEKAGHWSVSLQLEIDTPHQPPRALTRSGSTWGSVPTC